MQLLAKVSLHETVFRYKVLRVCYKTEVIEYFQVPDTKKPEVLVAAPPGQEEPQVSEGKEF